MKFLAQSIYWGILGIMFLLGLSGIGLFVWGMWQILNPYALLWIFLVALYVLGFMVSRAFTWAENYLKGENK